MKKFLSFILVIAIVIAGVYFYNNYTGNPVGEYLSMQDKSITTTVADSQAEKAEKDVELLIKNTLDDEEKQLYNTIYSGLSTLDKSINIGLNTDVNDAFHILRLITCDHPELFWVTGNCSYSAGRIMPEYYYSKEEAEIISKEISETAEDIYKKINPQGDDYSKSLAIFDYITLNTSYDHNAVQNLNENHTATTIEGVFLNGKAVCSGYAKAYQYLLMMSSISSAYITGTADTPTESGSHAWTVQKNDGEFYHTDITWADSYENSTQNDFVSHTYFCITEEEILKTHKIDSDIPHFICTETKDNYFNRQSLCFENYSQSDIRTAVKNNYKTCKGLELKFKNKSAFDEAKTDLIDNSNIYIILKSVDPFSKTINSNQISYNFDDTHNIIMIIFAK